MVTDPQTNKATNKQTNPQTGPLQYNAPLASTQCKKKHFYNANIKNSYKLYEAGQY